MTTFNVPNQSSRPLERKKVVAPILDYSERKDTEEPIGWIKESNEQIESQGIPAIGSIDDFNSKTTSNQELPKNPILGSIKPGEWFDITNAAAKTIDFLGGTASEVGTATSNLLTEQIFFSTPTETPNKPNNSQTSEQQKNNPETEQPALYNPNKVIEDAIAAGPVQVAQKDMEKAIGIAERQITDSDPAALGLNSSLRRKHILDAYHGMIIYKSDSDRQEVLEKSQSENSLGGVQGTHRVGGQGIDSKRFNRINLANEVADSNATKAVG